jgi:hypothetical protein
MTRASGAAAGEKRGKRRGRRRGWRLRLVVAEQGKRRRGAESKPGRGSGRRKKGKLTSGSRLSAAPSGREGEGSRGGAAVGGLGRRSWARVAAALREGRKEEES